MQQKLILLTRDKENSLDTKRILAKNGNKSFIHPLYKIKHIRQSKLADIIANKQIIITSYNALWPFMQKAELLRSAKDIFIVGEKSERFLEQHNLPFHKFLSARELSEFLQENYRDRRGSFLYLRGRDISLEFAPILRNLGQEYQEKVIYELEYENRLSEELIQKISLKQITHHISFSRLNAELFIKLLKESNLLLEARKIKITALSSNIAQVFYKEGFTDISAPNEPIFDDVLELCLASL